MSKFFELLIKYLTLPFVFIWDVILKPFGEWIGRNWQTFTTWVATNWAHFVGWLGKLPDLAPYGIGFVVLVVAIGELVFEGWLLRRIMQITKPWIRRILIVTTVLGFYVIACVQMTVVSLMFGLDVQWWLWITVTAMHLVGWALNTVLRIPFAMFWNWIRNLRPKYVIISAAGQGKKAWNYTSSADGRELNVGDRFRLQGKRADMLMINKHEGVYNAYANVVTA